MFRPSRLALGLLLPLTLAACSTASTPGTPAAFYGDGLDHRWTASSEEGQRLLASLTGGLQTQGVNLGLSLAVTAENNWGPIEVNQSNGETADRDGHILTLNGVPSTTGLGVHAYSDIHIHATGLETPACTRFRADIGIDDEVGDRGSVTFQVYADGVKIFDSGVMTGSSPTQHLNLPVGGKHDLRLVVDPGASIDYDHADWVGARLDCVDTQTGTAGSLDPSFDGDGLVQVPFQSPIETGEDPGFANVVVLPSGDLVARADYHLYSFTAQGKPNETYGEGQHGLVTPLNYPAQIRDMDLQPDGHILYSGNLYPDGSVHGYIERLLPSGAHDLGFGSTGVLTVPESYLQMAVQADGRFLTTGVTTVDGRTQLVVRRFQPNGTPDLTYGQSGVSVVDVGIQQNEGYGVVNVLVQPDGKAVVGGVRSSSLSGSSIANLHLTRLLPDGHLDTTFDGDGWVSSSIAGLGVSISALALTPAGQIVIVGIGMTTNFTFRNVVAQFKADGSLDQGFGTGGLVSLTDYSDNKDVVVQNDGRLLVTANPDRFNRNDVLRLEANGMLDKTFGTAGVVQVSYTQSLTLQPDGRILVAGGSSDTAAELRRLLP